jgi:hypothetical protein
LGVAPEHCIVVEEAEHGIEDRASCRNEEHRRQTRWRAFAGGHSGPISRPSG